MGGRSGTPAFVENGTVICRMQPGRRSPSNPGVFAAYELTDSSSLVRIELERGTVDTIASLKAARTVMATLEYEPGHVGIAPLVNPLPAGDDWSIMPDGSIAIVRVDDYHLELLRPDGSALAYAPIPFSRQALSPARKAALVDSAKIAIEAIQGLPVTGALVPTIRDPALPPVRMADMQRFTLIGAQVGSDVEGLARRRGREQTPLFVMPAAELPDTMPTFLLGSVRADREGNVWVGTTESAGDAAVYHVLNERGELRARVAIPKDRLLVGFGRGGALYLAVNEYGSAFLERVVFIP
jgi:hypothetical protein